VLGTSFNISAYTGRTTEIRVHSGKVKVQRHSNTLLLIKGTAAVAGWNDDKLEKKAIENAEPMWKKTLLDIDGLTLEAVVAQIQAGRELKVAYTDESLKRLKIKGTLDTRQGVEEMMQTIAFALGITVTSTDGKTYTIGK
jgi:transmembrane sensor